MSLTLRDGVFIVAVIVGMLSLMGAVRYFGARASLHAEMQRKLVHVATGTASLAFPLLFTNPLPVFILIGSSIIVMLALRAGGLKGLGAVLHDVKRESFGEIYLAIAIGLTFFLSHGVPILYVLPILVITLSDTASALVGTEYGKRRFAVEGGSKSFEGVAAFFVITWLIALVTLLLLSDAPRLNVVVLSFLIAAFCALVEVDSWRGLDNLFVPLGAHLLLVQYLGSGPAELVVAAIVFVGFLATMLFFAPSLDISKRVARGYSVLLFMLMSLMALQNTILAAMVIGLQLAARTARPCRSPRPDLDVLGFSASVGLFWLFAGELVGQSVISLFNLTFAAVALGFLALTFNGLWKLALVPAGVGFAVLFVWIAGLNTPFHPPWFASDWPWLATALALPALVVVVRPGWFATFRSAALFGLAMLVPLAFFIMRVVTK